MQFVFKNIFAADERPRVLITPSSEGSPSVEMYRLDDETIEWSHSWPIDALEELDHVLDAYSELIIARWREHTEAYTLNSPSFAETA